MANVSFLISGLEPGQTVNYSATPLIISASPLPLFTTITSVITLGIAFDRFVLYLAANKMQKSILLAG